MLLDAYGRPIRQQALKEMHAEPGITGIRQIWHGSTASGLTPVRMAQILRACDEGDLHEFLTLAEEMEERDPHYLSVLGTRKRKISGITPQVIPGDGPRADEIAQAIRDDLTNDDTFPELVEDLLDALGKSFSVVEIGWDTTSRTGRWKVGELVHRDPRWFTFDRATGRRIQLLTDTAPTEGEPLEPFKFLTHRAKMKSGLTYRGGLARFVAFGWMCKAYTLKDWMAFVETYGLPLRLGRYGPEATKDDVNALFRAVANIGTDAAAVLPKSMEIEFENGPTATASDVFEKLARFVDEQVSKVVLGQTMTADQGSSEAQARVHNEVRYDIAASDGRAVSATINRDLVKPYVDLNFGVQNVYPRILLSLDEPEDVKAKVEGAVALAGIGVTFKAGELRAKLGFSDPEEGDEVVGGQPAAAPPVATNRQRVALNREGQTADGQTADEIEDEIGAEMLEDWREVAEGLEGAIAEAVDGADSYEDLLDRLPETLKRMPTALVVDTLVKGMFKARALGDDRDG